MSQNEIIGEQTVIIHGLRRSLGQALGVLHALKSGQITLDQIAVAENGDVEVRPAAPANGHKKRDEVKV